MSVKPEYYKCGVCGWIHFGLSRAEIIGSGEDYADGVERMAARTKCARYSCIGSYKGFVPVSRRDVSVGATLLPILAPHEKL